MSVTYELRAVVKHILSPVSRDNPLEAVKQILSPVSRDNPLAARSHCLTPPESSGNLVSVLAIPIPVY